MKSEKELQEELIMELYNKYLTKQQLIKGELYVEFNDLDEIFRQYVKDYDKKVNND